MKSLTIFTCGLALALSSLVHAEDSIKVAVASEEYPPYFFTEGGKKVGFDIDLSKEVCKRINKKCVAQYSTFSKLISSVRFNKNDIVISAITDNEFRRKVIDFSQTYSPEEIKIAVNAKDPSTANFCSKCPKELDLGKSEQEKMLKDEMLKYFTGKKVGVFEGTTFELFFERNSEFKDKIEVVVLASRDEKLSQLSNNQIAATVGLSEAVLKTFKDKYPNIKLVNSNLTGSYFGYGLSVGVNKKHTALLAQINTALEEMKTDGTLEQLTQKWFKKSS